MHYILPSIKPFYLAYDETPFITFYQQLDRCVQYSAYVPSVSNGTIHALFPVLHVFRVRYKNGQVEGRLAAKRATLPEDLQYSHPQTNMVARPSRSEITTTTYNMLVLSHAVNFIFFFRTRLFSNAKLRKLSHPESESGCPNLT